jgi:histone deacetylase HOS3
MSSVADLVGNGTQALVMPLNAASYAEDIAVKAGKPPSSLKGSDGKRRRGWKGFYGSVHDIVSLQSCFNDDWRF